MAYAELHCHSNFSFLDGASAPDELVERAVELGLAGLAVTDHQGLYGAVRFAAAAEAAGIHPVIGVEVELLDAIVPDPAGVVGPARRPRRRRRGASEPVPGAEAVEGVPDRPRPERARLPGHRDAVKEDHRGIGDRSGARAAAGVLAERFPGRVHVELSHHLLPDDDWLVAESVALARELRLPVVVTNDVHYAGPDGVFGRTKIDLLDLQSNPLGLDRSDPAAKDDVTTVNQLYLPANRPIIVQLRSKDVIHSFGVPEFRVKQDAIPGLTIPIWFVPNVTTAEMRTRLGKPEFQYEIACAQLCGLGHARMRGFVTVQRAEEFQTWMDASIKEQSESASDPFR